MKPVLVLILTFLATGALGQLKDTVRDAIRLEAGLEGAGSVDCQKAGSLTEQRRCASLRFVKADSSMNAVFRLVLEHYRARRRDTGRLLVSQQQWIAARDKRCSKLSDDASGGSAESITYLECLAEFTLQRERWLRRLVRQTYPKF